MKTKLLLLLAFLYAINSFCQVTFYSEDFTGQLGKGATGAAPTVNLDNVDWTIDVSNAKSVNGFRFSVRELNNFEIFEARNVGEAIWLSPVLDISDFTDIAFSIDVSQGLNRLDDSDTLTTAYRIDGGTWINAETNGVLSNDYGSLQVSQTGLNGSMTLELKVTAINNANNERQRFGNIQVTGIGGCVGPVTPVAFNAIKAPNTTVELDWSLDDCNEDYLIIAKEGSEVTTIPTGDGSAYTADSNFGTGTETTTGEFVVYKGALNIETISNLVFGNTYFFTIFGRNGTSWSLGKLVDSTTGYCTSEGTRVEYDTHFTLVNFGDIENVTIVDEGAGYNDYTALTTRIGIGESENLIINLDTDGDFSVYSYAWIDWNRDGDFEDAGETYDLGFAVNTDDGVTSNSPLLITVPNNAELGDTRMRLVCEYYTDTIPSNGPCDGALDGEVVDYTVTVIPGYCTSEGTRDPKDTHFTLVNFGDINNDTSVDDGAGYHDYTAQITGLIRGESEDLVINLDTDGDFTVYSYAWIDWNRDGDFEDANESYDLGFAENTNNGITSNSPLSITVPTDAVIGRTRMRLLCESYDGTLPTNGPCDGALDGEVVDYRLRILPSNSYVYNNEWFPSNPIGISTPQDNITIIEGTINFNTDTNCNNLVVNPEANVTVDSGVTITVSNEMVLESNSTRYASLISDGTINGTTIYKRNVNFAAGAQFTTTANDLLSAPLTGQLFGNFRTTNTNILAGTIMGEPAFLFGPFNPASNLYVNYSPDDDFRSLEAGVGYRTGSTDGSTYTFIGIVETGIVNTPIIAGGASNWNLIGNPYPSYLNVQEFLNNMSTSGLIDENAVGLYGYDGEASDGWTIYNLATTTSSTVITPGQGFFVNAEASGDIQFTPSMRTTGTDDDFIIGRNSNSLVFLTLEISNATNDFKTDFYFNDNASLGLDPGYDANIWNGTPTNFSIYSHLVENNTGRAMALQALHNDDLFNVTIPLGVNANNSSDITFSISQSTIPDTIDVYLDDTEANTLVLLTEEDYILNLNSNTSGTGRFYLRFVDNQLNINEVELQTLNIFSNQTEKTIVVEGLLQQQTNLKIYDVQGRAVMNSTLTLHTNKQSVSVSNLNSGIYVVKIQSNSGFITKKIIVK